MLNDSANMLRMPGKYYTLEEAKELVAFCKGASGDAYPGDRYAGA